MKSPIMTTGCVNGEVRKPLFYPISEFYKARFGEKVFKIPVALSERCPNVKNPDRAKPCVFCDEWGSFAYPENQKRSLENQIELHKKRVADRYNNRKFFVYFQAYTTTYTQVKRVKEAFDTVFKI